MHHPRVPTGPAYEKVGNHKASVRRLRQVAYHPVSRTGNGASTSRSDINNTFFSSTRRVHSQPNWKSLRARIPSRLRRTPAVLLVFGFSVTPKVEELGVGHQISQSRSPTPVHHRSPPLRCPNDGWGDARHTQPVSNFAHDNFKRKAKRNTARREICIVSIVLHWCWSGQSNTQV